MRPWLMHLILAPIAVLATAVWSDQLLYVGTVALDDGSPTADVALTKDQLREIVDPSALDSSPRNEAPGGLAGALDGETQPPAAETVTRSTGPGTAEEKPVVTPAQLSLDEPETAALLPASSAAESSGRNPVPGPRVVGSEVSH